MAKRNIKKNIGGKVGHKLPSRENLISGVFDIWGREISRAKVLSDGVTFCEEGALLLAIYIDAFSQRRYPNNCDNRKFFKEIVMKYSRLDDMYQKIDLLFFYQWKTAGLQCEGRYNRLQCYDEIKDILISKYGGPNGFDNNKYIYPDEIIDTVNSNRFKGYDENNLRCNVSKFNLCEVLYLFARCSPVHENNFRLLNKQKDSDGSERCIEKHIINRQLIYDTVNNIFNNLKDDCLSLNKYPGELPN